MTTIQERLNWWRKKSYYLGDNVDADKINYITLDSNGNVVKESTTVVATVTIYTKSGRHALSRIETWIVPDVQNSNDSSYLTLPAYYKTYTISHTARMVLPIRRWRRWWR